MRARATTFLTIAAMGTVACTAEQTVVPELAVSFRRSEAPSGTYVVVVAHNRLDVYWQDNSPNETGYEVQRAIGSSGGFTLLVSLPAGSTAYGNTGLTEQTEYCYRVRAFRKSGKTTTYSEFSNTACATTPRVPVPAAPSGVRAAPQVSNSIGIAWIDNSSDETGFRIERSPSTAGPWTSVAAVASNVLSASDGQPPAFEQLACYRVLAFNSFGDSPPSNVFCTARPAPPSALATAVSSSAVDLTWTDNSNVEDGYQIQRWTDESGASVITIVAEVAANSTTYHDAGLADGKYWYQVRSMRDGSASASSNNVSAMVVTRAPFAPGAVDVVGASSSVASVTFTDNSTNEDGFRVERSTNGGGSWTVAGYTAVDPYWSGGGQFNDAEQPSEHQLCYRVIAFNSLGDSPPSNTDCTILPAGPTNLTATGVSPQTIELAWSDNSAVEDGYEVNAVFYYCSYFDEWGYCVFEPYYVWIATLAPNTTIFRHTGLNSGETWIYVVFAVRDGGRSDLSNEVNVTVP